MSDKLQFVAAPRQAKAYRTSKTPSATDLGDCAPEENWYILARVKTFIAVAGAVVSEIHT